MDIPPTPNIDAAAGGNGFGTVCRPLVTGGDPQWILSYAAQVAGKARSLVSTLTELERSRDQLSQLWQTGSGRDAALRKLAASFAQFDRTIEAANRFAHELEAAAGKLNTAQQGCTAAIHTTEPTVAALRSNPYTQAAATALATGTTASIASFLKGIGALFTAIGQNNLGGVLSSLGTIATGVAQLNNSGSTAALPATSIPATTTTTPTVASTDPTAQASLSNLGSLTAAPTTGSATTPPVPATLTAATPAVPATPAAAPATNGHHVTVTVNADGGVVVDSDIGADVVVVERNADGTEVDKHVTVTANGTASG
ncbi:MAG TPA: WXG100 family type VII secretion target [Rugosimonospora sp.]|nr:WXG100 family type VII secretion target [Rugosimonospora sp.]